MSVTNRMPPAAAMARWAARTLSGAILPFWAFFLLAHLVGDEGRPSRPLVWGDYLVLATIVMSLVGLALAWKWELAGGAVTLVAVVICTAVNWRVLVFPGTLVPLAGGLFMLSWSLSRASRDGVTERRAAR